jgi:glycosyltransferase involved in cell wall biosynthesis
LDQVVECFNYVRCHLPNLKLYIANPGYKANSDIKHGDEIVYLGSLPHKEIMRHVNESLCVFYPQNSFAETFGLIYAEANALGTAIIAHDIGSAAEIMDKNNPPININDRELIVLTIKKWQKNYPKISYNEKFSDNSIYNQWTRIFNKI